MARRVHGKRALLNSPGHDSTAAIVAEIEDTGHWRDGQDRSGEPLHDNGWYAPYSEFQITDCSRGVSLSVRVDSANGYRNSLRKVDTMIDALTKLRDGLVVERKRYVQRERIAKQAGS